MREVEISIESAKSKIEDLAALNRLANNKDFQRIIDTGYFRDKAAELVIGKADPAMQTPEHQASTLRSIDAIGELRQHFLAITNMGNMAQRGLEADEGTRNELLAEDLKAAN